VRLGRLVNPDGAGAALSFDRAQATVGLDAAGAGPELGAAAEGDTDLGFNVAAEAEQDPPLAAISASAIISRARLSPLAAASSTVVSAVSAAVTLIRPLGTSTRSLTGAGV